MKHPSLEVIDRAITLVESGRNPLTCLALIHALYELDRRNYTAQRYHYINQFRQFNRLTHGRFPRWWNAPLTDTNQSARVAALKAFRQACIDSAKKGDKHD